MNQPSDSPTVSSISGRTAIEAAEPRSAMMLSRFRPNRSAITPPPIAASNCGTAVTAATSAAAPIWPVLVSTITGSTIAASELPKTERPPEIR